MFDGASPSRRRGGRRAVQYNVTEGRVKYGDGGETSSPLENASKRVTENTIKMMDVEVVAVQFPISITAFWHIGGAIGRVGMYQCDYRWQ